MLYGGYVHQGDVMRKDHIYTQCFILQASVHVCSDKRTDLALGRCSRQTPSKSR